jgi:hypothetical protein
MPNVRMTPAMPGSVNAALARLIAPRISTALNSRLITATPPNTK